MIKPGFFDNEELSELSYPARILYIALWTLADRKGCLEDRPRRIKAYAFPYEDVDVATELNALERVGFIVRYEVGDGRFIHIPSFLRHQQPHYKEPNSTIPEPPCKDGAASNPSSANPESKYESIMDSDNSNVESSSHPDTESESESDTESESASVTMFASPEMPLPPPEDETPPPRMTEVGQLVFSRIPQAKQDALLWDECEQFGRDFDGRHVDVGRAIEEVRRSKLLPFPKNLRDVLEPHRPKAGAHANGHRITDEEARQSAADMERFKQSGRFFSE